MNKAPIPIPIPVKVTAINLAMLSAARAKASDADDKNVKTEILRTFFPVPTDARRDKLPELG